MSRPDLPDRRIPGPPPGPACVAPDCPPPGYGRRLLAAIVVVLAIVATPFVIMAIAAGARESRSRR